jgi:hypothetical protein
MGAGAAGPLGRRRRALVPRRGRNERAGSQTAKFVTRDNVRHRRDISAHTLPRFEPRRTRSSSPIRTFPGRPLPPGIEGRDQARH